MVFIRAIRGDTMLLTPGGLQATTEGYTIPNQSLSDLCGTFYVTQLNSDGTETERSVEFSMPTSASGVVIGPADPLPGCGDPPGGGGGGSGIVFANAFHHRDHLGTLRVVTDAAGQKISGHDFYPFGTEMAADDGAGSRKRFTGHERDAATGMDYMLARYYSSSLGRFLAVDPGDDTALEDPQSWNKYTYVGNNPLVRLDPDGKSWGLAVKALKIVVKGGDIASTVQGIRQDVKTLKDPKASTGAKVVAAVSLATEVLSPVSIRDAKTAMGLAKKADDVVDKAGDAAKAAKHTPDQEAVVDLAKEAKQKGGMTKSEAGTLKGFADEAGVEPARIDPGHPSGKNPATQGEHAHIGPVDHIPVKPDKKD